MWWLLELVVFLSNIAQIKFVFKTCTCREIKHKDLFLGVIPNSDFLTGSQLEVDSRKAVIVDKVTCIHPWDINPFNDGGTLPHSFTCNDFNCFFIDITLNFLNLSSWAFVFSNSSWGPTFQISLVLEMLPLSLWPFVETKGSTWVTGKCPKLKVTYGFKEPVACCDACCSLFLHHTSYL